MQSKHSFTIGVLSVTATILLVGVILTTVGGNNPAEAFGQIDRGGDYIMLTGQFTANTELVYVTDAAVGRLNVYSYEPSSRRFVLWDSQDFRRLFGAVAEP